MTIHLSRKGQQYGPYTLVQVNHYLEDGTVLPTDDAWAEGMAGWVPVGQIPGVELPGSIAANSIPPPPPPMMAAPFAPIGAPMPAPRTRRTGLIVGIVLGVLGVVLVVGLGQGDEGVEFGKMHRAYHSRIFPMEMETLKELQRLENVRSDREVLAIARDVENNLSMRILALKTIDLNHNEIEGLNDDYIKNCERGLESWGETIRALEAGNDREAEAILERLTKRELDGMIEWVKRFNRLCAKHDLPDLETIMEGIAEGM
ncbi:MAG: DUF4339 domain-containing protein [Verrucomicrobia subdivision 3 bacterium]|nr:DUF4339 domain-containing protein [Limisphaerales bacterium]